MYNLFDLSSWVLTSADALVKQSQCMGLSQPECSVNEKKHCFQMCGVGDIATVAEALKQALPELDSTCPLVL
jgi:hypothetical protein